MRFLADAGISPRTIEFLRQLGHDAAHVRALGMQRATDHEVIDRARAEGRVILTFDETADSVNHRIGLVISEQSEALDSGALILVEDARYRMRKLR